MNGAAEKAEVDTQYVQLKEYSNCNSDIVKEGEWMSPSTEKQQV